MYSFSERSRQRLDECHEDLVTLMEHVIQYVDITISEGQRGKERQNRLYDKGATQVRWPNSNHNAGEGAGRAKSHAVDIVPHPFDGNDKSADGIGWNNKARFHYMGGIVLGVAHELHWRGEIDHEVRWGGDWKQDNNPANESFYDGPHFEIVTD